jgi:hypothetical protein
MGKYERNGLITPAGVVATACMKEGTRRNTGSPSGDSQSESTGNSREPGRAVWGGGEARSTAERVNEFETGRVRV